MQIGLIDVDSKIPNLALMKLSAFHKAQGDQIKLYDPMFDKPDLCYASKVFKFSEDYHYFPECPVIRGGSGYDLKSTLPEKAEHIMPDYSLYPQLDCNMGFTSRGCIRSCGFCIVPQKEGKWHVATDDIREFWDGQKYLKLLDNNLTADNDHFEKILKQVIKHKIRLDINQGVDIRLIDDLKALLLSKVSMKTLRIAWDSMDIEQEVLTGINTLKKYMVGSKIMVYILIGYDTTEEEDLYRVEMLKSLGVEPFVMPFGKTKYQKRFTRWINKWIHRSTPWVEYTG